MRASSKLLIDRDQQAKPQYRALTPWGEVSCSCRGARWWPEPELGTWGQGNGKRQGAAVALQVFDKLGQEHTTEF